MVQAAITERKNIYLKATTYILVEMPRSAGLKCLKVLDLKSKPCHLFLSILGTYARSCVFLEHIFKTFLMATSTRKYLTQANV